MLYYAIVVPFDRPLQAFLNLKSDIQDAEKHFCLEVYVDKFRPGIQKRNSLVHSQISQDRIRILDKIAQSEILTSKPKDEGWRQSSQIDERKTAPGSDMSKRSTSR